MILFSLHFVNTVILSTPTCWRGDELKVFRCFGANDGPAQVLMNPNTDQENHTTDQLWESRQLTDPESAWAPKQGTSQPVSQTDRQAVRGQQRGMSGLSLPCLWLCVYGGNIPLVAYYSLLRGVGLFFTRQEEGDCFCWGGG